MSRIMLCLLFGLQIKAQFDKTLLKYHNLGRAIPQLPLNPVPPRVQARLARANFTYDTFPGYIQLALLFNTGYIFDANHELVPFYTRCNTSSSVLELPPGAVEHACATTLQKCRRDLRLLEWPSGNLSSVIQCAVAMPGNETEIGSGPLYINLLERSVLQHEARRPIPRAVRRQVGEEEIIVIVCLDEKEQPKCEEDVVTGEESFPCVNYEPGDGKWCPPVPDAYVELVMKNYVTNMNRQVPEIIPIRRPISTQEKQNGPPLWVFILASVLTLAMLLGFYIDRRSQESLQVLLESTAAARVNTNTCALLGDGTMCEQEWIVQAHARGITIIPAHEITLHEKIGEGFSSEVYVAEFAGIPVAIKNVISWQPLGPALDLADEIMLVMTLYHPNVLLYLGIASMPRIGLCLVSEYMEHGDLLETLQNTEIELSWQDKKLEIAMDSIAGLKYLHNLETPILHRDIKSRNILLNQHFQAKLADFGLSSPLLTSTMTITGSYLWLAPEILRGERYGVKADIYSYGIVLSELATRHLPYADQQVRNGTKLTALAIAGLAANENWRPTLTECCPTEIKELFLLCVDENEHVRPSAAEAHELLRGLKAKYFLS